MIRRIREEAGGGRVAARVEGRGARDSKRVAAACVCVCREQMLLWSGGRDVWRRSVVDWS